MIGKFSRLIFVLCVVASPAPNAHATRPSEYQVKAAFLYNFAKFVEWPAEAFADTSAPIILGVLGQDPFGVVLEQTIQGKTVRGRTLVIRRFERIQDVEVCHVLFVSSSEEKHLARILEGLKGSGVLTVSEMEQFARNGGIIQFIMQENKVRFEINVDAAERAGLKISSKLLKLSRVVTDERER